jgi:hypothetical protein
MSDQNYVKAATKGPNGVANAFLAGLRGKEICITAGTGGAACILGKLIAWDHYHILIMRKVKVGGGREVPCPTLLTKKPGWQIRESRGDTDG